MPESDDRGVSRDDYLATMRDLSFALALLRGSHRFHQSLVAAVTEHGGPNPDVPALVERIGSLLRENAAMQQQLARFVSRFEQD